MGYNRFSTINKFEGNSAPTGSERVPTTTAQIHFGPYDSTGNYILQNGNSSWFVDLMLSKYGKTVTVHNHSKGGSNAADWTAESTRGYLAEALASATNHSNAIFLTGVGTNGDTSSEVFADSLESAVLDILGAGHGVIMGSIISTAGTSTGSYAAKNTDYLFPLIQSILPESFDAGLGKPHADLRGVTWGFGSVAFEGTVHPGKYLSRIILAEWAEAINNYMDVTLVDSPASTLRKPTVLITGSETVASNTTTTLTALKRDPDPDETVEVSWSVVGNATLSATTGDTVDVTLGEAGGSVEVTAYADDGTLQSHPLTFIINQSDGAPVITETTLLLEFDTNTVIVGEPFTLNATTQNANSVIWEFTGDVTLSATEGSSITATANSAGMFTITATALGDENNATDSMGGLANQPPTANAGPDQSVAAGVTVQLDASSSTPGTYPIASYEWTQTAGDSITLTDATTSTPEFTAPSTSNEQTLTFSVVPVDTEGNRGTAKVVSIVVAAFVFTGSALELLDTLDFTLVTDGNIIAYPGRANREILKVTASSLLGLDVDDDDYINFEGNDIVKVEVIVFTSRERQVLSSETDSVFRVEGSLKVRFGDLNFTYFTEPAALGVVVYVAGDTRGVVLTTPAVNDTSQVLFYQKAGVI